jgi:hypothetical protein
MDTSHDDLKSLTSLQTGGNSLAATRREKKGTDLVVARLAHSHPACTQLATRSSSAFQTRYSARNVTPPFPNHAIVGRRHRRTTVQNPSPGASRSEPSKPVNKRYYNTTFFLFVQRRQGQSGESRRRPCKYPCTSPGHSRTRNNSGRTRVNRSGTR